MKTNFTDYAIMRMKMRDILEEEVMEALSQPQSKHSKGKIYPRKEVRHRVSNKTLLVVYGQGREQESVDVINAMWE